MGTITEHVKGWWKALMARKPWAIVVGVIAVVIILVLIF